MRLVQVITDYIRRSILTTQGDLVVRGAAQPQRLAAGIIGTILRGKGAGELPAYEDFTGAVGTFLAGQGAGVVPGFEGHKLSDHGMVTGQFTRTTAGNEVISGLAFRPSLIFFFARCDVTTDRNWSVGIDNGSHRMILHSYFANTRMYNNLTWSIDITKSVGNGIFGKITTISNDGYTFTFTLNGTSCAIVTWFAIE